MGAVFADTTHKEFFNAALIVLGHHHSWSLQVLSSDADDFTNGILVCIEVCYLNLMRDLVCLSLGNKSLFYEVLCFPDLQYVLNTTEMLPEALTTSSLCNSCTRELTQWSPQSKGCTWACD